MTDRKQRLAALADKVEQLQRPNETTDGEVAVAMGWQRPTLPGVCGARYQWRARYEWHDETGVPRGFYPPAYTASLDAAMTLVPEDRDWSVSRSTGGIAIHAWCGSQDDAFAATPALALCAAALRAQSETVA